MEENGNGAWKCEIGTPLDAEKFTDAFTKKGRVRIENFLSPACAETLYRHLATDIAWRSFIVANQRLLATPELTEASTSADEEREIFERAYDGARNGFAYLYDADQLFPEDEPEGAPATAVARSECLTQFSALLNSPVILDDLRKLTGIPRIASVQIQATRFRVGHFATFHAATRIADKSLKRVASLMLNLTPEWKPEWGGLLEFRADHGAAIEAHAPWFNALDVFRFPQGHWVSTVAPFASGARLAIHGRVYMA
jgi:SM-20-related protein